MSAKKEKTLAQALGFSDKRGKEILRSVIKTMRKNDNLNETLLELHDKFDDNELLLACYMCGGVEIKTRLEGHEMLDKLKGQLKELRELLGK